MVGERERRPPQRIKQGGHGKGTGIFSKNKKSLEGSKQTKAIFKGF